MSQHIPKSLSDLVRERAIGLCEYCQLPQWSQEATFHIDHIHPYASEGLTVAENLALACVTCSLCKAAKTKGKDPLTGLLASLFHFIRVKIAGQIIFVSYAMGKSQAALP